MDFTPTPIDVLCSRIKINGADLISAAARLHGYALTNQSSAFVAEHERKMIRRFATEIMSAIDAYEEVACGASVEIITPPTNIVAMRDFSNSERV